MSITLLGIELTTLVSVGVTVFGLIITYKAHRSNMRKDADSRAAADARLLAEMQAIKDNILGMRAQIKELGDQQRLYGERLAAVEIKADRAHIRLDRLEERINNLGN